MTCQMDPSSDPGCPTVPAVWPSANRLTSREPQMWGTSLRAAQLLRGSGGPGLQEGNLSSVSSVQSLSRVRLFVTLWIAGLPIHHQLPEFTQTHVHRVSDAIQPSHPLSSPFPPAPIPLNIRVFSNESALCMRWPKYWSFSFSISPSSEHPGLISFRVDRLQKLNIHSCIKPPQTQVLTQTLLTQNPQRWDPGIHIFQSSPGYSRVQPG